MSPQRRSHTDLKPETLCSSHICLYFAVHTTELHHLYIDSDNFSGWLLAVANLVNPPLVVSISYGASEASITASEFDAFNLQAIKLGLMGVTILASSGGQLSSKK